MARKAGLGGFAALALAPEAGEGPLFRRLYRELRRAILDGRLGAGARLPATRLAARELGLSRNTVLAAYEQLLSEGFIEMRPRSGAFVAAALPIAAAAPPPRHRSPAGEAQPQAPHLGRIGAETLAAARGARAGREQPRWPGCFIAGAPDVTEFPFALWARLLARTWRHPDPAVPIGGDAGGDPALRAAIAAYLREARGIACDADHVLIVTGIRQALDLACRLLLEAGDRVWMENPGYPGLRAVLAANGARIVPVPVDDEGIDVPAGRKRAGKARLVCVAPSHQYPLGVTLSLQRRLMLLDWARASKAWVIEDDYDSEYRYAGRPLAALKSLDADHRVIYVGTLSKLLFPSLRLGYLVAPPQLAEPFRRLRAALDDQPSMVAQPALAELFRSGHLAAHVRRMRQIYAGRQRLLLEGAARHLSGLVELRSDEAGLHLVARQTGRLARRKDVDLAAAARKEGIVLSALSDYDAAGDAPRGLMFGYAAATERAIDPALRRLAEIWTR
jgi:GntR family transcriptional regulator/MocR family aminotransferase